MLSRAMSVKDIQEHTYLRRDDVMQTRANEHRSFTRLLWAALCTMLLCALPAFAQDPEVNSAEPSSAEQETTDLVVTVGGDNFGSDSAVDFFVTGTGDSGGIHVKKVKRQGPKTLKVTIDVDSEATVDGFDIQVQSRGRTGKGIELFRVIEKTHPTPDKTPPGQPTNLSAATTYGSVSLSWTMPADDGTDAASGSVERCAYYDGGGEDWRNFTWPLCNPAYPWGGPGILQVCLLNNLDPGTTYSWGVVCVDEAGNESIPAPIEFTTPTFTRDPSWTIEEVPIPLEGLVGHQFDPAGNVVIGGVMGLWDQVGKRKWSLIPTEIRIITGTWDDQSKMWSWSYEDVPGVANRLQIDPTSGRPAFQGGDVIDVRNGLRDLVYTYHDGDAWRNEIITTEPRLRNALGFAFDPNTSQPVIAWCSADEAGGVRLARRVDADQWSIKSVSQEECWDMPRSAGLAFDGDGKPAITYRAASAVKMVRWSGRRLG